MTTLHVTNDFNVEATITKYFRNAFTAITRPSVLPTLPTFYDNLPETTPSFPCFSFVHMPAGSIDIFQGRNAELNTKTTRNLGILDLSAWVSRSAVDWMAQLRVMTAMINTAFIDSHSGIIIKDYTTTPANPTNTAYRAVLNDLDFVSVNDDPNPDIQRRRALVRYQWNMRSTN